MEGAYDIMSACTLPALFLPYRSVESVCTVPLQGKLTVSTRNSILDPRSFWESSFDTRVLRIDDRESMIENRWSRIEFWGSSFENRDTRRFFRGSRTEILRKRFNSRKQNNSDEQNNWRAALFAQTRFECMQIFIGVVHLWKKSSVTHFLINKFGEKYHGPEFKIDLPIKLKFRS